MDVMAYGPGKQNRHGGRDGCAAGCELRAPGVTVFVGQRQDATLGLVADQVAVVERA